MDVYTYEPPWDSMFTAEKHRIDENRLVETDE
jgi:hypothetical protein